MIAGDECHHVGAQVEDAAAVCHGDFFGGEGDGGLLQGGGAGQCLRNENDQIGMHSFDSLFKSIGWDICAEIDHINPRRRRKRDSSNGVKVCHSLAGQPTSTVSDARGQGMR